jgi:hypothetical protein
MIRIVANAATPGPIVSFFGYAPEDGCCAPAAFARDAPPRPAVRPYPKPKEQKMKKIPWPLLMALALPGVACAGVSAEYEFSSETSGDSRPAHAAARHTWIEIDGPRFRIHGGRGQTETSLDDGASTFFGNDQAPRQNPFAPAPDGSLGPIRAWVEDERISINTTGDGPQLFGMATTIYLVDHSYVTVARMAGVFTRRFIRMRSTG